MRFNARELACIAQEKGSYFDFESTLFVREKVEGIFKKSKAFSERLFRLKGNILFYFKGKDKSYDVAGIYILERCCIQLEEDDIDDIHLYCFSIVFGGEPAMSQAFLGSQQEHIRDRWIELLHISSYECMKFQMDILRDQIRSKSGKDPVLQPQENYLVPNATNSQDITNGTNLELCIHCRDLPPDEYGRQPDTFMTLHYFSNNLKYQWVYHGRTEIIEKNSFPNYVSVITFRNFGVVSLKTKLKLSLRIIKERMTNTALTLATAEFTLMEILTSPTMSACFTLRSSKFDEMGTTILSLLINANSSNKGGLAKQPTEMDLIFNKKKLEELPARSHFQSMRSCCTGIDFFFFTSRIVKTFRFPAKTSDTSLLVNEHLLEFKHAFLLPCHYLDMLIEDEKQKILSLRNLGKLKDKYETIRGNIIDFYLSNLISYDQQLKFFCNKKELSFKPSIKKNHKEVELVPTNLHLHSMYVSYNPDECFRYDIITVGAFTASTHKYKHGGVRRLSAQLNMHLSKADKKGTKFECSKNLLRFLMGLKKKIYLSCDEVCSAAVKGKIQLVRDSFKVLEQRVNNMLKKAEEDLVTSGVLRLLCAQFVSSPDGSVRASDSFTESTELQDLTIEESSRASQPIESWMWNGTGYVKHATEEPFDMIKLNTEAALVSLRSRLQEMFQQSEKEAVMWLEMVSPQIIILKKSVEMLLERGARGLNFLIMEEVGSNLPLYHSLKCRRDVVFCQAITSAAAGFLSKLSCLLTSTSSFSHPYSSFFYSTPHQDQKHTHSSSHQPDSVMSTSPTLLSITRISQALTIFSKIGILMQFESLLSCYGDEMCMLEDHSEAVADLSKVKIRLKSSVTDDTVANSQTDNSKVCVNINSSVDNDSTLADHDKAHVNSDYQAEDPADVTYKIVGNRESCEVVITLPNNIYEYIRSMIQLKNKSSFDKNGDSFAFHLVPIIFTIGINEQATFAERLFSVELQEQLNKENYQKLDEYYKNFNSLTGDLKSQNTKELNVLMKSLHQNIFNSKKSKNVDILHLAAEICIQMEGIRYTSCKSAKDRTSMSVTLEEVSLLKREYGLSTELFGHALDSLRSEGVRRDNTYKNTGVRKYAFNSIQLLSIPKLYRPPKGTFGNLEC